MGEGHDLPCPLSRDSGGLRVIPGTHRGHGPDLFAALRRGDRSEDFRPFGMRAVEIGSVALETEPGDILVFTERSIHGSLGGGIRRHQVWGNFAANPETERHLAQIKQFYESDRPRIRRMVQKPLEGGFKVLDF